MKSKKNLYGDPPLPVQQVNGIIDGMAVLEALATHHDVVSGLALAKELGLSPIRINRLLRTFAHLGYAYRSSDRKYGAGPALYFLAARHLGVSGIMRRSIPLLTRLTPPDCIAALGTLRRDEVCYLYYNNPAIAGAGKVGISPDMLYPWRQSSIGHALMAWRDVDTTTVTEEELAEFERIRKCGYAMEWYNDHWSVAVPVGDPPYVALAVSGITDDDEAKKIGETLIEEVK